MIGLMKNKLILVALIGVFGCQTEATKEATLDLNNEVVVVPQFSSDSAYNFVQAQVDFGPRIPNSKEHKVTGDYLVRKLGEFGAVVTEQEFESTAYDGTVLQLRNIVGEFNPESNKRILLAAHWDTRPWASKDPVEPTAKFDGANDGASGVGVLLEVARAISVNKGPGVGVDIIFFDGEDWGQEGGGSFESWCLGSQYWSKNLHKPGYGAYYGILLDMVGAENATFPIEGYSQRVASKVVSKVWDQGNAIGHGRYFKYDKKSEITDDHYFVTENTRIPMIDIVHYSDGDYFGDFHHTKSDNMDIISKNTLGAVGETLLNVIYRE